jgi:hypothetical protein
MAMARPWRAAAKNRSFPKSFELWGLANENGWTVASVEEGHRYFKDLD